MSTTVFALGIAVLAPALIAILAALAGMIADELREGHRGAGYAMIGVIAVIVTAALPWFQL